MRSIRISLIGLVLAGILAIVATPAAFAHGGGGGGHFGGGHFSGFVGHGFSPHEGAHFAPHYSHGGHYWCGDRYCYDYPYYGYDDGDYTEAGASPSKAAPAEQTIIAVQQELAKLGFYHGQIDGLVGLETRQAISGFQSVEMLIVTGRIDEATLNTLQISF
jgi:Putative peptidoglycan binding domain